MNYIVVSPNTSSDATVHVAEYLAKHTELKPIIVQYNGFASLYSVESYATKDTIINPIALAEDLYNKDTKTLYISPYCRVFTPYNNGYKDVIEYYDDELFVPTAEKLFSNPYEFLTTAKEHYKTYVDKYSEGLFINSITAIRDKVVIEKSYYDSVYINREVDNIFLCKESLLVDSQRGLFPSPLKVYIDIVSKLKEEAIVYLVIDFAELTIYNLDKLNRIIDRHCLDNIKDYTYYLVMTNFNELKSIIFNGTTYKFTLEIFISLVRRLYLHIEDIFIFKNNQLSCGKF